MSEYLGARVDKNVKRDFQSLVGRGFKPDDILMFGINRCKSIKVTKSPVTKEDKKVFPLKAKRNINYNAFPKLVRKKK